ncbi:hypothetical protein ACHAXS_001191 [Conticribra weissflogii]
MHWVNVQQYHGDTRHFADNAFISCYKSNQQLLTYCEVNPRYKHGIANRANRDFQEQARKSFLYAINH